MDMLNLLSHKIEAYLGDMMTRGTLISRCRHDDSNLRNLVHDKAW